MHHRSEGQDGDSGRGDCPRDCVRDPAAAEVDVNEIVIRPTAQVSSEAGIAVFRCGSYALTKKRGKEFNTESVRQFQPRPGSPRGQPARGGSVCFETLGLEKLPEYSSQL
jgi:hypothetical protein